MQQFSHPHYHTLTSCQRRSVDATSCQRRSVDAIYHWNCLQLCIQHPPIARLKNLVSTLYSV